jgi:hypothetical protein
MWLLVFAVGERDRFGLVTYRRAIKDARMVVGFNSASMWWLNGKVVGDRRMVMHDCASKRLAFNKGWNVIPGAVINGPGLSDFALSMKMVNRSRLFPRLNENIWNLNPLKRVGAPGA